MARFLTIATRVQRQVQVPARTAYRAPNLSCPARHGPHCVIPAARALGLPIHASAADAMRLFIVIFACATVAFAAQA